MIAYRHCVIPERGKLDHPGEVKAPASARPLHTALYRWIDECANADKRCPSTRDISARFKVSRGDAADLYVILERQGFIACFHTNNARTVLVLETGKHTKPPSNRRGFDAWLAQRAV